MRESFARLTQPLMVKFLRHKEHYTFNGCMRCEGWWIRTWIGNVRVLYESRWLALVLLVYPAWSEDCIIIRVTPNFKIERVRP